MLFDYTRFLLSHNVIYIIKFNKFVFNKRYSLKCLGFDFQKISEQENGRKSGLWFLCFFSNQRTLFKAVVYLELIIYLCLLNSKTKG